MNTADRGSGLQSQALLVLSLPRSVFFVLLDLQFNTTIKSLCIYNGLQCSEVL